MASIPSTGDRISRWTPTIFACAFVNFVLAQLLLVAGISWPAALDTSGATLAAVHLLTIGSITLLMFGALFPVRAGSCQPKTLQPGALRRDIAPHRTGLAGMVGGFLQLGTRWVLPVGGCAAILGMLAGGLNLAIPLTQKRPWPLSARLSWRT